MATKKRLLSPTGLDGNSLTLTNVATPSASSDASTKGYVDTLVPSQTGNTGKYLTTNGTATSWGTIAGGGTVTSITAGTGLSGGTITTSGTITIDTAVTVDKTTAQTLTNKTLTSPTFTAPVLGTPASGTLTNCTFPTLNQNTTGSAGSVANTLTITSPLSGTSYNGSSAVSIGIPVATTSVNGYLSSTDWTTFNNKGSGTVTSIGSTTLTTGGTSAVPTVNLTSGIVTAGTTGSASLIPVVTVDTYGRVTAITTAANPQGTVTSVTGTSPVVSSGGTTPAISMPVATTSVSGYLSSTDWTTFNNKGSGSVTSVTGGTYLTGGTITTTGTLAVDATSANTASKVVARDASGNFSAGTITANGLDITGSASPLIRIIENTTTGNPKLQLLDYTSITTPTEGTELWYESSTGHSYLSSIYSAGSLIFRTANTEKVRITSAGSLGIGTDSPSAKLSVYGGINVGSSSTTDTIIQKNVAGTGSYSLWLTSGAGVTGETYPISISDSWSGSAIRSIGGPMTDDYGGSLEYYANGKIGGVSSNQHKWYTRSSANTYAERMRITSGGDLGLGTVSPSFKLDVNGTGNFNGVLSIASGTATSGANQGLAIYHGSDASGYGRIRFYENNSNNATIHNFSSTWQNGSSSTINTTSTGCINLDGPYGVTIGGWNGPTASFNRVSGLSTFNGAVTITGALGVSGAITQAGNQVLHAGNYYNYAIARNGDTVDGIIYFRANKGNGLYLSNTSNMQLQAYSSDGGTAAMSFHRAGLYAVNMGLDPDNVFRIGGWSASANRLQLDMSGNLTVAASVNGTEFYASGWFRNSNSGTGLYNVATGNHFYSDGQYWNAAYSGTQGIRFRNGHAGSILGYLYAETSGYFGLLTNQGSWSIMSRPNGAGITFYGTEIAVAQTLYVHEADNPKRVPRTFVQSGTPSGTITNGDVWLQHA